MKKQIAEFFSKCGTLFRRDEVQPDSPAMAKYREFFYEELEKIQKNPVWAAHIFASNRFDDMIRDDERDWAEKHESSVLPDNISVGNESDRKQRTEQLIELAKSYSPPAAERCPEKDEQNETAQQQPDTGGENSKMSLRQLFEIYGDKPIILHYGKSYSPPAVERCPEKDEPDLEPS